MTTYPQRTLNRRLQEVKQLKAKLPENSKYITMLSLYEEEIEQALRILALQSLINSVGKK